MGMSMRPTVEELLTFRLENHLSELIARIEKHVGECDDRSLAVGSFGSCIHGPSRTPWRSLQEEPRFRSFLNRWTHKLPC